MPVNANPKYLAAEKEYFASETLKEKLEALEKMISLAPSHKGAEKLRAELKTRYKKLKEKSERGKKKGSGKQGIKKEDMQMVIVGFTKSGKSTLLNALTNVKAETGDYFFITKNPIIGVMDYHGTKIQAIESPSLESEYYDRGLVNNADAVLILVTNLKDIEKIEEIIGKFQNQIIAFNKTDLLNANEKRKIAATLSSRKSNFVLISAKYNNGIEELKDKIFNSFGKIRIYTKEPGKEAEREKPLILLPDSTVEEVAKKIFRTLSNIKEIKIWGPSSKFPGQIVGFHHKLKDLDVVEFKTR